MSQNTNNEIHWKEKVAMVTDVITISPGISGWLLMLFLFAFFYHENFTSKSEDNTNFL